MDIIDIILIGVCLASDAFAVSICKGLSIKKNYLKKAIIVALYFSIFQAVMPTIGYFIGKIFSNLIIEIDHWIAFISLSLIGINMILESKKTNQEDDLINFKSMIMLSIATSIDALTIGIIFATLNVNLLISVLIIGIITFILCFVGVNIGVMFGSGLEEKSQTLGGIILIIIGLKILIEHIF